MSNPLTLAAQQMLSNSGMSSAGIDALTSAANTSPYFAGLLNAAASQGKTISMGSAGGGTAGNPDGSGITVDPTWVPGSSTGEQPLVFATTIAHEFAHQVLPGGDSPAPADSPDQAATIGGNNEGVALTAEYIVATQLGLGTAQTGYMHSDQGQSGQPAAGTLTASLNQAAASTGLDVGSLTFGSVAASNFTQIGSAAENAAAQFNLDYQHPSVAPNLLYGEYYSDYNIIASCSNTGPYINPANVNWLDMQPIDLHYVDNGNGTCTFQGTGIPLIGGGTGNIGGTVPGQSGTTPATILTDYVSQGSATNVASAYVVNSTGVADNYNFSGASGAPTLNSSGTIKVPTNSGSYTFDPTTGIVSGQNAVSVNLSNQVITLITQSSGSTFAVIQSTGAGAPSSSVLSVLAYPRWSGAASMTSHPLSRRGGPSRISPVGGNRKARRQSSDRLCGFDVREGREGGGSRCQAAGRNRCSGGRIGFFEHDRSLVEMSGWSESAAISLAGHTRRLPVWTEPAKLSGKEWRSAHRCRHDVSILVGGHG